LAIGCEACHGPGELHVKEMQTPREFSLGQNEVDSSIVNPTKLPPQLADDICRYCHQSRDTVVLLPGKGYQDFRPGTPLENEGQHQEAERVLELGFPAYPYLGALAARLALQYFSDGQTRQASIVVHQFRKLFPEDPTVRSVLNQLQAGRSNDLLSTPASGAASPTK
jgi:hypothetical protein